MAWCTYCTDEYEPVEYASVSLDPDEVRFCSDDCEEAFGVEEEALTAYNEARYSGASVF